MVSANDTDSRRAFVAGAFGYLIWGVLPLYMHALLSVGVGPAELVAHRIVWGTFWAFGLVLLARQGGEVRALLASPKMLGVLGASTLFIFINWSIYVVAVAQHRVLEASLGYFINPLMNMAAGAWLFRERLSRAGMTAIALASIGVAIQAVALGHLPLISLGLALSFCAYGVVRKRAPVSAQAGLLIECLFLVLPAAGFVIWLQSRGEGAIFDSPAAFWLLMAAGPATVAPLALFAWAARRLPLTAMGFLQFLAPSLQFLAGLWLGEAFTPLRGVSFAFIWAGAAVFAYGGWRAGRAALPG